MAFEILSSHIKLALNTCLMATLADKDKYPIESNWVDIFVSGRRTRKIFKDTCSRLVDRKWFEFISIYLAESPSIMETVHAL